MLASFLNDTIRPQALEIFRDKNELELMLLAGVTQNFKKGEIIFKEGGIPNGIFYLKKGHVKKYKGTSLGSEQIFYICASGEILGYHSVLAETWYSDSAATLDECEITFIPKDVFQRALQVSPELSLRLLKALAHEFRLFKIGIATLATSSVKERLAINLLILDEKFRKSPKSTKGSEIILSRSDLANMVGTAKENLVRMLADFKTNGLIKITDNGIQITNRDKIIKAASLIGKI